MATEIEMNFKVVDKPGLLKYLRSLATEKLSTTKMTYFERDGDGSFYVRTEEIDDDKGHSDYLTAKGGFLKKDGINERTEISIKIPNNTKEYFNFLTLIGLKHKGSKSKTKHRFIINKLIVTVDEWNVEELGDRLEIEGEDKIKIKEFSLNILPFCDKTPS